MLNIFKNGAFIIQNCSIEGMTLNLLSKNMKYIVNKVLLVLEYFY